jgi:hypothetical protein
VGFSAILIDLMMDLVANYPIKEREQPAGWELKIVKSKKTS